MLAAKSKPLPQPTIALDKHLINSELELPGRNSSCFADVVPAAFILWPQQLRLHGRSNQRRAAVKRAGGGAGRRAAMSAMRIGTAAGLLQSIRTPEAARLQHRLGRKPARAGAVRIAALRLIAQYRVLHTSKASSPKARDSLAASPCLLWNAVQPLVALPA